MEGETQLLIPKITLKHKDTNNVQKFLLLGAVIIMIGILAALVSSLVSSSPSGSTSSASNTTNTNNNLTVNTATSTGITPPATYPDGTLIQVIGTPGIYIIQGGVPQYLTYVAWLAMNSPQAVQITQAQLNQLPTPNTTPYIPNPPLITDGNRNYLVNSDGSISWCINPSICGGSSTIFTKISSVSGVPISTTTPFITNGPVGGSTYAGAIISTDKINFLDSTSQGSQTGAILQSDDGNHHLIMQNDGNLVLYHSPAGSASNSTWATNTSQGASNTKYIASMQNDGSFVVYSGQTVLWSSGTYQKGKAPYALILQNDGNLVIYDASFTNIWNSSSANEHFIQARYIFDDLNNEFTYDYVPY